LGFFFGGGWGAPYFLNNQSFLKIPPLFHPTNASPRSLPLRDLSHTRRHVPFCFFCLHSAPKFFFFDGVPPSGPDPPKFPFLVPTPFFSSTSAEQAHFSFFFPPSVLFFSPPRLFSAVERLLFARAGREPSEISLSP